MSYPTFPEDFEVSRTEELLVALADALRAQDELRACPDLSSRENAYLAALDRLRAQLTACGVRV